MSKAFTLAVILFALAATAAAQDAPKAEAPPQPSAEQQREFAAAVAQAQSAQKEVEAAQARLEAARAKAEAQLYKIMAQLKLSPDEWHAVLKEGRLTFERVPKPKQ